MNATKPFGNNTPQSTCCGGTGSENHTKYQQAAYFANDHTLWVALYMPTTLHWKAKGITVQQDCLWPAQHSVIRIKEGEGDFTLKLRVPYWATQGFSVRVNGQSVDVQPAPSSYLSLERKHWKQGDVIEIDMPLTKHIEYGADKLTSDVASLAGTPLKTSWVGTLMYGPLVMTGTGVETWAQATLHLDSRLSQAIISEVKDATSGAHANLFTLNVDGKIFQPDYYRNKNSTHYYRIDLTDVESMKGKKEKIDLAPLQSVLALAQQRKKEQEAWQTLRVKVPEYAPWAPHGYERMRQAMEKAQQLLSKGKKKMTQDELEGSTAILNKAVTTMRPGNLAEMEDLQPLSELLRRAGWPDDSSTKELKEAVNYGRMVQKYVSDGSGTHDMIKTAVEKLQKALGMDSFI